MTGGGDHFVDCNNRLLCCLSMCHLYVCLQRLVHQFQNDTSTRVAVLSMRAAGVVCSYRYAGGRSVM